MSEEKSPIERLAALRQIMADRKRAAEAAKADNLKRFSATQDCLRSLAKRLMLLHGIELEPAGTASISANSEIAQQSQLDWRFDDEGRFAVGVFRVTGRQADLLIKFHADCGASASDAYLIHDGDRVTEDVAFDLAVAVVEANFRKA